MTPQAEFGQCLADIRRIHGVLYLKFLGCAGHAIRVCVVAGLMPLFVCEIYTAVTSATLPFLNVEAILIIPLMSVLSAVTSRMHSRAITSRSRTPNQKKNLLRSLALLQLMIKVYVAYDLEPLLAIGEKILQIHLDNSRATIGRSMHPNIDLSQRYARLASIIYRTNKLFLCSISFACVTSPLTTKLLLGEPLTCTRIAVPGYADGTPLATPLAWLVEIFAELASHPMVVVFDGLCYLSIVNMPFVATVIGRRIETSERGIE